MKIPSKFSLALLAGTILSTPANYAAAATLTPTLDTLKAEATDLSGSYALTELSGELPAGAAEVEIAGVKYYFTPEGEDAALLKTLAGTVAGNLVEDAGGIFELNGKKYSFNTEAIPSSVFEYVEGKAEDYNFTIEEADAEGNLTTKYYKVVLKPETFATLESIKWSTMAAVETPGMTDSDLSDDNQVKGVVKVDLPNNKSEYYEYTYTKPADYEIVTGKPLDFKFNEDPGTTIHQPGGAVINNPEGETYEDIKSKVYADNKVTGSISGRTSSKKNELYLYGGAIYNAGEMGNINADFINNFAKTRVILFDMNDCLAGYSLGGAIYNKGSISNIMGNFIENYIYAEGHNVASYAYGGAIYNDGSIGKITGDFIGNQARRWSNAYGGAIYNSGTIGDIIGDFIRNYAEDGGAIYNESTIGDITGDFIGNYVSGSNYAYGGAIFNSGTIGDIVVDFIGNYSSVNLYKAIAFGGAIYNDDTATIGNITGDFISNYARSESGNAYGGAIYNIDSTIGDITGDFVRNYVSGSNYARGGAIYNDQGTIGDITGDFIGNYAQSESGQAQGGAIYNEYGTIGDITGDFVGNYAVSESGNVIGGAIYNYRSHGTATIGDITGDFVGNYAVSESGNVIGGAIYNDDIFGNITGNFIGNYTIRTEGDAIGGAIYNNDTATIGNITGDFISNYARSKSGSANGGAIYNKAQITAAQPSLPDTDNLIFHLDVKYEDQKLEIYLPKGNPSDGNMQMVTGTITVNSEEEFLSYKQLSIYNHLLEVDPANFGAEDYVDLMIQLGAVQEEQREEFLAEFEALSPEEQEKALAAIRLMVESMQNMVNNATLVTEITATVDTEGGMNFYNSSFRNNYVKSENGEAKGGAIYGSGVTITADNYTSIIDGNKANDESNAFYVLNKIGTTSVDGNLQDDLQDMFPGGDINLDLTINMPVIGDLTLNTLNNGVILLNDGIDGESGYGIAFNGDKGIEEENLRTTQYIKLNNSIANAGSINIANTTLSFGEGPYGRGEITADGDPITKISLQNAAFDLYNKYQEKVTLKGWSANNGYLHIDVDVDNLTADMLNINGNVEGTTKLVLYPTSDKDIRGESILFAQSTNDTTGNADSFKVWRVYRSPYMFETKYTETGENAHKWELEMKDTTNDYAGVEPGEQPDPEVPDVEDPEVPDIEDPEIPDIDLPTAPSKVYAEVVAYGALPAAALEQTRNMVDNIGGQVAATRTQDAAANYNLWVNPTYYTSNIDSPFAIDADIWGIEAGGDIQRDINNRLGIFVSYRQGEYDMSGNGDRYYSTVGSEIDIDSYIAGLYYRYDHNNWYAFATLYGGIQEADIKTDDGMKTDTDGVEFGASAEVGYDYALTDSVTLTPELGVFYTQVNYDDASDNVGKSASYDDARQIELEAGVKLAKTFMLDEGFANVYVKPSVVQTIVDGEDVNITGLGDVEALDDATLGRIEIGGRYGFTTNLSAYGWANYTFGSDYDATTFGLGLNYAF